MLSEYHFNKASFRIPDRVVPVYGELQWFNEHPTNAPNMQNSGTQWVNFTAVNVATRSDVPYFTSLAPPKRNTTLVVASPPELSRATTLISICCMPCGALPVKRPVPESNFNQSGSGLPSAWRASSTTDAFVSECLKVSFGSVKLNSDPAGTVVAPKERTLTKPEFSPPPSAELLEDEDPT